MEAQSFIRTSCYLCDGPMEFPPEMENQVIPCPHCGKEIKLLDAAQSALQRQAANLILPLDAAAEVRDAPPGTTESPTLRPEELPSPTSLPTVTRPRRYSRNVVVGLGAAVALAFIMGMAALVGFRYGRHAQQASTAPAATTNTAPKGEDSEAAPTWDNTSPAVAADTAPVVAVNTTPAAAPNGLEALRARADQGNADAQYGLGEVYYRGKDVPQDYAEAMKWYRKAAERGDAKAQFSLGWMYSYGEGVLKDDAEALLWWRKAAAQGNEGARNILPQAEQIAFRKRILSDLSRLRGQSVPAQLAGFKDILAREVAHNGKSPLALQIERDWRRIYAEYLARIQVQRQVEAARRQAQWQAVAQRPAQWQPALMQGQAEEPRINLSDIPLPRATTRLRPDYLGGYRATDDKGSILPSSRGGMVIGGPMNGSILPGREGGMVIGGSMDGSILPRR